MEIVPLPAVEVDVKVLVDPTHRSVLPVKEGAGFACSATANVDDVLVQPLLLVITNV